MTAAEMFTVEVICGRVPASIPVRTIDGRKTGLMTQGFNPSAEAQVMVESDDPQERALAALMVCRRARTLLEGHESLLATPI